MSAKSKSEKVMCQHFTWRIKQQRFDVWYADGRSGSQSLGRHSLGTKSKDEAMERLRQLDVQMAVQLHLVPATVLESQDQLLSISDGAAMYLKHVGRPKVVGGACKRTIRRYGSVFQKFNRFASTEGVVSWQHVTKRLLGKYSAWMDEAEYAYRTEYLELTTIKQTMKWLADEHLIPQQCLFNMSLKKAQGTPTYCYQESEVAAILDYCNSHQRTIWLGRVISVLAYTGMRIGEVAQLEWRDIDIHERLIHVRDETRGAAMRTSDPSRSTKSGRSRVIPVHRELHRMLEVMAKDNNQGRVFTGPLGGTLKPDVVRVVLKRDVLPKVNLQLYGGGGNQEFLHGRIHSFRHFFVTSAYRSGWSERGILDVVGHTNSGITRHYRHIGEKEYQAAMNRMPSLGAVLDD